jgi:hypothetical protein
MSVLHGRLRTLPKVLAAAAYGGIVGLVLFMLPGSILLWLGWLLLEPAFLLLPADVAWWGGLLLAAGVSGVVVSTPFALAAGPGRVALGAMLSVGMTAGLYAGYPGEPFAALVLGVMGTGAELCVLSVLGAASLSEALIFERLERGPGTPVEGV